MKFLYFRKWLAGELNKALDKPHDRALFEDWFAEAPGTQPESTESADKRPATGELV